MKWLKLFEDFKDNNQEGTLISEEDIINCIKSGGTLFTTSVSSEGSPEIKNLEETGLKPQSIEGGKITAEFDNHLYEVDLSDVKRIEF
jgi:hypothetical protein